MDRSVPAPNLSRRYFVSPGISSEWKRATAALLLFGVSFGYVEAAVVDYLEALNQPVRERFHPARGRDDLFPLLTLEQVRAAGPDELRLLQAELAREAATLVMLGAVALAVAGGGAAWLAAFMIAFGVWDISFYAFLKVLLHWPQSLLTWDLLFLLPVPWAGPVLAPVLVALSMIGMGFVILRRKWAGRPVSLGRHHWLGIIAGALIVVLAFTWDFRNLTAGGMPNPFNWPLFVLGGAVSLGTFAHAVRASGVD